MSRNIRLTLAYEGTNYAGWQVQPDRPTVQQALERAIFELTGEPAAVLAAGRTDAGVHALGQTANFVTESTIPTDKWRAALQSRLPGDIVIRQASEAPPDFHATYAARRKHYRYLIDNRTVADPFLRRFCWRVTGFLDTEAMHREAQSLVGTHDFRSFESHWPNTADSIRTLTDACVRRAAAWDLGSGEPDVASPAGRGGEEPPPLIVFDLRGDGFLYHMVRTIVGSLVKVGRGIWPPGRITDILQARNRGEAGETAPPQGLFLMSVKYDAETECPNPDF